MRLTQTKGTEMKIKKIIEVVDTREYETMEGRLGRDRSVPIPGSGEINVCCRCGKEHEVHVHVEFEDGSVAV